MANSHLPQAVLERLRFLVLRAVSMHTNTGSATRSTCPSSAHPTTQNHAPELRLAPAPHGTAGSAQQHGEGGQHAQHSREDDGRPRVRVEHTGPLREGGHATEVRARAAQPVEGMHGGGVWVV